jgi:hypothetical protein
MPINVKFPAAAVVVLALAATPVALASGGATATSTPTRAKVGTTVRILIKGMKPAEKVKAKEVAPNGQTRTIYPTRRVNASGVLLVTLKAQVKGKHTWTFTGRTSHRSAKTAYYVK